jgi:hypothetical protein
MQPIRAFEFEARRTSVKASCMGGSHRRTFNKAKMSALLVRGTDLTRKLLKSQEPD